MPKFVINDESKKNSHGFYLVNAGGDFTRFNNNPVMLFNHNLGDIIGRWSNLGVEGATLSAETDFDMDDPESARIAGKVEREYVKGASPGIFIQDAEWREHPTTKEYELYVTRWELLEVSVCSVPSNAGALSLRIYDGEQNMISEDRIELHVKGIAQLSADKTNQNIMSTQPVRIELSAQARVCLGVNDAADTAVISEAITALHAKYEDANKKYLNLKSDVDAKNAKEVSDVVELAIKEGKIKAEDKQSYIDFGATNLSALKTMLGGIQERQSLSAVVTPVGGSGDIPSDRKTWTLSAWMKNDMPGLQQLKVNSPEAYKEICNKK